MPVKTTTHLAPALQQTTTRCCHKDPRSLPIKDKITLRRELVTCQG